MKNKDYQISFELSSRKKHILVYILIIFYLGAFLLGILRDYPIIYYICTLAIIMLIVGIFIRSEIISSVNVSFYIIYVWLLIDYIFFYNETGHIHVLIFILSTLIFIRDYKIASSYTILFSGILIIIGGLSFSFWIHDNYDYSRYYAWDGEIVNMHTLIVYCAYVIIISIFYYYYIDKYKHEYIHMKIPLNSLKSDNKIYKMDFSGMELSDLSNINFENVIKPNIQIDNIDFSFNNIKKIEKSFCDAFPSNSSYNFFRNGLKNKNINECVECNYLKTKCKITKK